jgi:hypothetical protein
MKTIKGTITFPVNLWHVEKETDKTRMDIGYFTDECAANRARHKHGYDDCEAYLLTCVRIEEEFGGVHYLEIKTMAPLTQIDKDLIEWRDEARAVALAKLSEEDRQLLGV